MNVIISGIAILILFASLCLISLAIYRQFLLIIFTNQLHENNKEILRLRVSHLSDPVNKLKEKANETAWSGYRKFVLKGKVLEAEGICSFYFAPHDKKPLPPFIPGQYLTFRINIPGITKNVVRCYSLSDSPNHPDYYRVTIKRIDPPADDPKGKPGLISNHFHKVLQAEDIVDVKAPTGHFYLNTDHARPVVLIGGGIGVTPMISMINYLVNSGTTREVWFFYGVRNSTEHIMIDYINEIAKVNPNIHLHVCYSHRLEIDAQNKYHHHEERISVELFKKVLPANNYEFYICGPPPMMEAITRDLKEWDVPEDKINFEAFGPSTVRRIVPEDVTKMAQTKGIAVKFTRSGLSLKWDGVSSSLLDFAEKADILMDSGCRAGNCGSCSIAIRSGEVEYLSPPGVNVDKGMCLTCISIPKSDLILDA